MEPRGSARHRWENREVEWAGAHESKREPNEFQSTRMNTNRRCSGGCVSRKALNLATSCYARRLTRRRKSNEGGLSRDQTSRYTKIDIFFPVHGSGDYVWSVVGNKCSMLN